MDSPELRLIREVTEQIKRDASKPFTVSVMGQTGVGKSSLINALFATHLKTDPIRPCTKEIERVVVKDVDGHVMWFYDLPGIGESDTADDQYLADYKQSLLDSDVVLWAVHADSRSVAFDFAALRQLLAGFDQAQQVHLMSKVTFVLTKVDLLAPPPWILATAHSQGVFAPCQATTNLLRQKAAYFQDAFLRPYGNLIVSQTYNDGTFNIRERNLEYDDYAVRYRGFLSDEQLDALKARHPEHNAVFDRLYDNYRVIFCSSLFRFNLAQLMLVIVNKLGSDAIGRFNNFTREGSMNRVPMSDAVKYCNIVVFDQIRSQVVFDLSQVERQQVERQDERRPPWLRIRNRT